MRASNLITDVAKQSMNVMTLDFQCLKCEALERQKQKIRFRQTLIILYPKCFAQKQRS